MMNKVVEFAMRVFGLGKLIDALDGESSKAYTGGVGMILGGAAVALGGVAGMIGQFVGVHGGPEYLAFFQAIPHNPSAGLVAAGWVGICKGWAAIGQRHAVAKLEAKIDVTSAASGPATPQ